MLFQRRIDPLPSIAQDPRGWIQIGESHWEEVRESRDGFIWKAIHTKLEKHTR